MKRILLLSVFLLAALCHVSPVLFAQRSHLMSPPLREYAAASTSENDYTNGEPSSVIHSGNVVSAVVLKSWPGSGLPVWRDLNDNWSSYGDTEVIIDHKSLINVSSFTFQDLLDSKADVVILSDPAGAGLQYSEEEVAALSAYAAMGHNLLATYVAFQNIGFIDNRQLAPLFGIDSVLFHYRDVTPTYIHQDSTSALFTNIPNPYISNGYPASQVPSCGGRWDASALDGASIVGATAPYHAVITMYEGGGYSAVYISTMPEYFGNDADAQFLYNAITLTVSSGTAVSDAVRLRSGSEVDPSNNSPGRGRAVGAQSGVAPTEFELHQNYPNPFNPSTTFRYALAEPGLVSLKIYNMLGQLVRTVVDEHQVEGYHEALWDGRNESGATVAGGIYVYRMIAGSFVETKRMLLIK